MQLSMRAIDWCNLSAEHFRNVSPTVMDLLLGPRDRGVFERG
jgi:hypothetical protein